MGGSVEKKMKKTMKGINLILAVTLGASAMGCLARYENRILTLAAGVFTAAAVYLFGRLVKILLRGLGVLSDDLPSASLSTEEGER